MDPNTQSRLSKAFASMMAVAAARETRWSAEIDEAPHAGPCPTCGRPGQPIDEVESLEESTKANALRLIYGVCHPCATEARTQDTLRGYGVPRRVRHATFVNYETPDPRQAAAAETVRAWTTDPLSVFLLLLGNCGTGKGHLAASAVRSMRSTAKWLSHPTLIDEYLAAGLERQPGYLGRLKRVPVLVIDEMGTKPLTPSTPEIFYKLLEARYEEGLKTILIGNIAIRPRDPKKPVEGKTYLLDLIGGGRMESRLDAAATVVGCPWGDYRRRKD